MPNCGLASRTAIRWAVCDKRMALHAGRPEPDEKARLHDCSNLDRAISAALAAAHSLAATGGQRPYATAVMASFFKPLLGGRLARARIGRRRPGDRLRLAAARARRIPSDAT